MDWYYAEGKERKGPINDTQVASLIAAGTIRAETLVWNNTMTDWQPAHATGLFTLKPGEQVCIITGKLFPESLMIKTEHGWVSVEGKDLYYQSLREGVAIPVVAGHTNARADGKQFVVPISGAKLPPRCVKTNQPVSEAEISRKALYWCTPYVYFALLLNILVVLILYFILRKKVMLDIPLSKGGKGIVSKGRWIAWGTFFAGLAMAIGGGIMASETESSLAPFIIILGFLMLLVGLLMGSRKSSVLRVTKIRGDEVWLTGACRDFVDSLPPYR